MATGILAVNYYCHLKTLDTTAANNSPLRFFQGTSGGTDVVNELGTDGILPDNKQGDITAIMFRFTQQASATTTTAGADARYLDHFINNGNVELFVSGTKVWQAPLFCCPSPPTWVNVSSTTTTSADNAFVSVQPAGWAPMTIAHPVQPRQSISVVLTQRQNAGVNPTTAPRLMCILQVSDTRAIAS